MILKGIFNKSLDVAEDKWQSELDKERDLYQAKIDRIQHRSEKNYDTELEIFRSLSVATADMVRDISILVPIGIAYYPSDHDEKLKLQEKQFDDALHSTVTAQNAIYGNLPFIPEKFANQYTEILRLCNFQLDAYSKRFNVGYIAPQAEKEKYEKEDYNRTEEINNKFKALTADIRRYLIDSEILPGKKKDKQKDNNDDK